MSNKCSWRRRAGRPGRLLLLALLVAPASCGGGPRLYPVRGRVLYEGQPANGAIVFFHPLGESRPDDASGASARPMGKVGPDGWFELTTAERGKGAPPGRYAVTVVWKSRSPAGDDDEKNLLPPRYMFPTGSQLIAEVKEGSNELPPFLLTR
jgi:hypothetical protein